MKNIMKKVVFLASICAICMLMALTPVYLKANADSTSLTTNKDFTMVSGASIRLDEVNGIRFCAKLGNNLPEGDNIEYHTIIVPKNYLDGLNIAVSENTNYYVELDNKLKEYDTKKGTNLRSSLIVLNNTPFCKENTYYLRGSITNIRFDNSNEDFFGICYYTSVVNGETKYVYANISEEGSNERSIGYVATKAYNDKNKSFNDVQKLILENYIKNSINKFRSQPEGTEINLLNLATLTDIELFKNEKANISLNILSYMVEYRSSNPEISIDNNGNIASTNAGTTNITANAFGKEYKCKVTINDYQHKFTVSNFGGAWYDSSNYKEINVGKEYANQKVALSVKLGGNVKYDGAWENNVLGIFASDTNGQAVNFEVNSSIAESYFTTTSNYEKEVIINAPVNADGKTYITLALWGGTEEFRSGIKGDIYLKDIKFAACTVNFQSERADFRDSLIIIPTDLEAGADVTLSIDLELYSTSAYTDVRSFYRLWGDNTPVYEDIPSLVSGASEAGYKHYSVNTKVMNNPKIKIQNTEISVSGNYVVVNLLNVSKDGYANCKNPQIDFLGYTVNFQSQRQQAGFKDALIIIPTQLQPQTDVSISFDIDLTSTSQYTAIRSFYRLWGNNTPVYGDVADMHNGVSESGFRHYSCNTKVMNNSVIKIQGTDINISGNYIIINLCDVAYDGVAFYKNIKVEASKK